jgi:GTPase
MTDNFKAGFVSIIGKPNAGKSTFLNAILGEKLAIVSHKAQTTRHRIMGFMNDDSYQIIFSDTPGIIHNPEYGMHQRMMQQVTSSFKDADVILYLIDINNAEQDAQELFTEFAPDNKSIIVFNKIDKGISGLPEAIKPLIGDTPVYYISALKNENIKNLLDAIVAKLPVHPPYYDADDISDKPMKFFVAELIREQLFLQLEKELPYHSTVLVEAYQQKTTLIKIIANIVVSRETQKAIVLGEGGSKIKSIGSKARESIEQFVGSKVFLELHVKVRDNWRNKDNYLNEYGY